MPLLSPPPPPEEAVKAMGQLELFLHKETSLPILVTCALIHYQFETIHPFLDGNGRLGRLLITFYLCWKDVLHKPLLYISYFFKLHRQEYYDRLNAVRERGDYEQWIAFFLRGVAWTSESALETVKNILSLGETHKKILVQKRLSTPLAIALLDHLFLKPHISAHDISNELNVSRQTAQHLINQFLDLRILKEVTGKKRGRRFSYWEYLEYLSEGTKV